MIQGEQGRISIETTSDAENPIRQGKMPLLVIDVWEHAYYLDYHNERERYLESITRILNWEFAEYGFGEGHLSEAV